MAYDEVCILTNKPATKLFSMSPPVTAHHVWTPWKTGSDLRSFSPLVAGLHTSHPALRIGTSIKNQRGLSQTFPDLFQIVLSQGRA